MTQDLARLVDAVGPGPEGGYSARPVPGSAIHFAGRDGRGAPVLLLGSRDAPHGLTAPIRLKGIEVQFATPCRLNLPDGRVDERRLSVVGCAATEPEIQRYFLQVCGAILQLVGSNPSFTQVTGAVRRMIDLFQRLLRPAVRDVLGLYGELLLIAWSTSAHDALRAWRSAPEARFDFALDDLRLDVKASTGRVRTHHFALEQCRSAPSTIGVIASLLIEPGTGASISDLVGRIQSRLAGEPDLQMKLHDTVVESLGAGIAEGLRVRFDDRAARGTLAFFLADDVPAPKGPIPPAVSEVRFKADLSALTPRSRTEIIAASAVATQLLPPS